MYVNKFFLADALYSKNFGRKTRKNGVITNFLISLFFLLRLSKETFLKNADL